MRKTLGLARQIVAQYSFLMRSTSRALRSESMSSLRLWQRAWATRAAAASGWPLRAVAAALPAAHSVATCAAACSESWRVVRLRPGWRPVAAPPPCSPSTSPHRRRQGRRTPAASLCTSRRTTRRRRRHRCRHRCRHRRPHRPRRRDHARPRLSTRSQTSSPCDETTRARALPGGARQWPATCRPQLRAPQSSGRRRKMGARRRAVPASASRQLSRGGWRMGGGRMLS